MKKSIAITLSLLITTSAIADNCPNIIDLKSNKTLHWKAYDSDNGKPLSSERETRIKNAIKHFAMAEWTNTHDKSVIHCYYNNEHGSAMETYFAKDSVLPIRPSKYWYKVTGMMQCAAGADKCQFQVLPEMKNQLASNDGVAVVATSLRGARRATRQPSLSYAAE